MRIEYNGRLIEANIIGEFKTNEKEYIVTSYADDQEEYKIVILQVIRNGEEIKAINVPKEDIEEVLSVYEEIKNSLMEEEDE